MHQIHAIENNPLVVAMWITGTNTLLFYKEKCKQAQTF